MYLACWPSVSFPLYSALLLALYIYYSCSIHSIQLKHLHLLYRPYIPVPYVTLGIPIVRVLIMSTLPSGTQGFGDVFPSNNFLALPMLRSDSIMHEFQNSSERFRHVSGLCSVLDGDLLLPRLPEPLDNGDRPLLPDRLLFGLPADAVLEERGVR